MLECQGSELSMCLRSGEAALDGSSREQRGEPEGWWKVLAGTSLASERQEAHELARSL